MFYIVNPKFMCVCKEELVWKSKEEKYWCSFCKEFYKDDNVHNNFLIIQSDNQ